MRSVKIGMSFRSSRGVWMRDGELPRQGFIIQGCASSTGMQRLDL
jgi:hypothetical protein